MKITKTDIFWWVVWGLGFLVIVAGCLAMTSKHGGGKTYDEPRHRAEISAIYPSVEWPEYRDAAQEICDLPDAEFGYVRALADDEGPEAAKAMIVNTRYLCPNRLKSDD